jgi:hypothetical protein
MDVLAAALARAALTTADTGRGQLVWRISGRECRRSAYDEITLTGGGLPAYSLQIEGIDLDALG